MPDAGTGPITVDSALGPDALVFLAMTGRESLGRPFEYIVDLVSQNPNLSLADLLGQPLAVHLELSDSSLRHFHGIVTEVDFVENSGPTATYRVSVSPWFSLLGNTTNCRIYQNLSVPDIVKQIFRDRGFTEFEESLTADYAKADYVVQYRESDFNFISRLLEHVGIYYYFRHAADGHTLVLADSHSAHKRTPGCEQLPYYDPEEHRVRLEEYVDSWRLTQRLTPGAVALRDFDFERPNADLSASLSAPKDNARADYEVYDYPGAYKVRADGETQARVRLEQRQESYEEVGGRTNARAFTMGALFELTDHPRDDQNREYLISSAHITLSGHRLQAGDHDDDVTFSCEFGAIDSRVPFRTAPTTKKPVVEGPQTAIVVGKGGEDIWTDKYGRVKVQFHWDRLGEHNENSSCWVRVAQAWAGSNWGSIHIPRIGQEVIVDFLEGDPDRPIITGRVYNGSNMPPYDLPGNQTQSGIKSRSTKGGGVPNANEIRFEDRKGSEEFFVQAEKDLNSVVKHCETRNVGVDRTTAIGDNESLTVGKNRTVEVKVDETILVDGNESRTVGGNETIAVTGNETVTIGGNESVAISGNQSLSVTGSRNQEILIADNIIVGAAQSITAGTQALTVGARTKTVATSESASIGGAYSQDVGGAVSITIGGSRTESVGADETVSISGGQTITVGKKGAISVTQQLVIDAGDELVIKAGDASITLKKNGDIVLKGKNLTSDASGKVSLKAASDLVLKGSKISQN
jgi:type VI secretion system secreted protein VgrG